MATCALLPRRDRIRQSSLHLQLDDPHHAAWYKNVVHSGCMSGHKCICFKQETNIYSIALFRWHNKSGHILRSLCLKRGIYVEHENQPLSTVKETYGATTRLLDTIGYGEHEAEVIYDTSNSSCIVTITVAGKFVGVALIPILGLPTAADLSILCWRCKTSHGLVESVILWTPYSVNSYISPLIEPKQTLVFHFTSIPINEVICRHFVFWWFATATFISIHRQNATFK